MPALLSTAVHLTVWLALLALLFAPAERLFALRRRAAPRALAADLGYFYLNGLAPTLLLALPLGALAAVARRLLPDGYIAAMAALPLWAALPLSLVVADLGSYLVHRACHRAPLLWRFHAVHHAPEHLDWLVNTRAHPVDIVLTRLGALAPLYLLGLDTAGRHPGVVPLLVTVLGTFWAFLIHANVRWRFGPLEQLVATPAFHHWHHTNDAHRDRNFAATLPVIDRLFGTLHLPREWPEVYGIDRPEEAAALLGPRRAAPPAPAPIEA